MEKKHFGLVIVVIAVALSVPCSHSATITPIGNILVEDSTGNGAFSGLTTMDKVTIEGVALNDPDIFSGDPANLDFILFVQDDTGSIEVYSGAWYGGGARNYPTIKAGDRVRVTGLTGFYGGQTNVNERHNPDQKFVIEILGSGETPKPLVIEDLTSATQFDSTLKTGGEFYQGRLVILKNVKIVDGTWGNGAILTVTDPKGGKITLELRAATKIGDNSAPVGAFDVIGVFNQEDTEAPFTGNYKVWPRSFQDFKPAGSGVEHWDVLR